MEDLFEGTPAQEEKPKKGGKKAAAKAAPVVESEEAAEPEVVIPEPKGIKLSAERPHRARRRKAVIFIENEVGQPNYKFVGINGRGYQIKRGEEVVVPMAVVEVLSNAKAYRLVQNADGSRSNQEFLATPFRVLRYIEE